MKQYVIRTPRPRAWQVIAANKAQWIASIEASEAEKERRFNHAAVVTLRSRAAARRFVESIGGSWE